MIKFKNHIARNLIIIISIILCVFLTGCPAYIPNGEERKSGKFYRDEIDRNFHSAYGVIFSQDNLPTVKIEYQIQDGTKKVAAFSLDGYNDEAKIGYKMVTLEDAAKWDSQRKEGNLEAPDLNDASVIELKAVEYSFPVIFLWIPDYVEDQNTYKLYNKLKVLLNTDAMKEWINKIKN